MKVSLINEVMNIKKIMGLIKEDTELSSQSSDLSKVQSLFVHHQKDLVKKKTI